MIQKIKSFLFHLFRLLVFSIGLIIAFILSLIVFMVSFFWNPIKDKESDLTHN